MPSGKPNDRIVMDINKLSSEIIGAAIEVHIALGPGLLESAYEQCLFHELNLRGLSYERSETFGCSV
jgi:GxxExxY protein